MSDNTVLDLIAQNLDRYGGELIGLRKDFHELNLRSAKTDERIVTILEDNEYFIKDIARQEKRITKVEKILHLNNYIQGAAPRLFLTMVASFAGGATLLYTCLKVVGIV